MPKPYVRRDVIKLTAGLGLVGLVGLAGCLGGEETVGGDAPGTGTPTPAPTPEPDPTATPEPTATPDGATGGSPTAGLWAQAYGNAANTGYSSASGPTVGAVRWSSGVGGTIDTPPVTFGGRLFVTSRKKLFALRTTDGSTAWSRTFGSEIAHAVACVEGMVLVPSNRLEAVAPDTGQSLWSSSVGERPVTDLTVHDGVVYFGAADGKVYGVSVTDGSQVARSALFPFGGIQTPATDGTYVYVAASDNIVGLKLSGSQVWKRDTDGAVQVPPMVDGDTVYVGTGSGSLYALDRKTGTVLWTTELGGAVSATPTISDHGLFVVSGTTLYRLEPGTGRIEWQQRVSESALTAPAHAADTIYVGSAGHRVYALNPENGAVRWSKKTDQPVVGGPALVGDALYVNMSGGTVVAFE